MSTRRLDRIRQGAAIGGVGALAALAAEAVVRRVPLAQESAVRRSLLRVVLGVGAAVAADAADAPEAVSSGAIAGPIFTSLLDLGGEFIRRRRTLPPRGPSVVLEGAPGSVPVVVEVGNPSRVPVGGVRDDLPAAEAFVPGTRELAPVATVV